jgi:nitrogen fixation protein NifU and related proteins
MLPYSTKVLEHFHQPRHVGRLDRYHGIGRLGDPDCGDFLEMTILLTDDFQRIADIAFLVKGCPAAIATSSMTTELACGRTVEEAAALTDTTVIHALDGLPPGKEHCSMLAVRGLQLALQNAVLRLLFKRAGIVDSDEAFDRLVESGEIDRYLPHSCDGSCEGSPAEACVPAPASPSTEAP